MIHTEHVSTKQFVLVVLIAGLKGYSTKFTNKGQFTGHGESFTAYEHSCMSSVALEGAFWSLR